MERIGFDVTPAFYGIDCENFLFTHEDTPSWSFICRDLRKGCCRRNFEFRVMIGWSRNVGIMLKFQIEHKFYYQRTTSTNQKSINFLQKVTRIRELLLFFAGGSICYHNFEFWKSEAAFLIEPHAHWTWNFDRLCIHPSTLLRKYWKIPREARYVTH